MANQGKGIEISGQKLWCGSLGVIEYLQSFPDFVVGKTVVELGAGTGVLGMLCERLGASMVTLTDHDTTSIKHMREDVARNEISNTHVDVLDWFNPAIPPHLLSQSDEGPQFQLRIVAGDVLYKSVLLDPFFTTVNQLFSLPIEAQFILCHVPRAGVEHEDIIIAARSAGIILEEQPAEHWRKGSCLAYAPPEDTDRARLYIARKK